MYTGLDLSLSTVSLNFVTILRVCGVRPADFKNAAKHLEYSPCAELDLFERDMIVDRMRVFSVYAGLSLW